MLFWILCVFFQINCVAMRGFNDDEICDFVGFTMKKVTNMHFLFYIKESKTRKPEQRPHSLQHSCAPHLKGKEPPILQHFQF